MASSTDIAYWQTILSGIIGAVLTVAGQTFIQWLQNRRARSDETWRADKKALESYEVYCARFLDVCRTQWSVSSEEDVSRYVNQAFDQLEIERALHQPLLQRFPELKAAAIQFFDGISQTSQEWQAIGLSEDRLGRQSKILNDRLDAVIKEVDRITGRSIK